MGTSVFVRGAVLLVPGLVSVLWFAPVWAQAQGLALPQVVEYSLHNNGDLKSLREEKGVRDAVKTRAGLLPNPTLEMELGTGALTGSSAESTLSLGVSQEFLLSGKREKRLSLAELEMEVYSRQLADRERLLSVEVQTAFYQVILAEQRMLLADRAILLDRQLLELTKERLTAGDIPELELNLVKVQLARSAGARMEVAKVLQQNQAKLWTLMGLPVGETPALAGTLEAGIAMTRSLADLKQLARENRPDLKALQAERGRGEADLILARAEGVPNITAGVALIRDATSIEVGGLEARETAYTLGLKLSMPIPVFDRNQAGMQEARARRNSTESRLTAAGKAVEREVETAYASLLNADQVLSLYRIDIFPQLEENLKLTREAYGLGEVGILSVIEEQRKFGQVNDGYLTALHDRQLALSALEAAVATDLSGGAQ